MWTFISYGYMVRSPACYTRRYLLKTSVSCCLTFVCSITLSLIHQRGKNHALKYRDIWRWRQARTRLSETNNTTKSICINNKIWTAATVNYPGGWQLNQTLASCVNINANLSIAAFRVSLPWGINVSLSSVKGPSWSKRTFREMYSKGFLIVSGSSMVWNDVW